MIATLGVAISSQFLQLIIDNISSATCLLESYLLRTQYWYTCKHAEIMKIDVRQLPTDVYGWWWWWWFTRSVNFNLSLSLSSNECSTGFQLELVQTAELTLSRSSSWRVALVYHHEDSGFLCLCWSWDFVMAHAYSMCTISCHHFTMLWLDFLVPRVLWIVHCFKSWG